MSDKPEGEALSEHAVLEELSTPVEKDFEAAADLGSLFEVEKRRRNARTGGAKMLPEGWAMRRLGDVATFRNGLNFTRADEGEAIKIVGVADFKDRSELVGTDGLATVRVADRVRDGDLLRSGDLLFVRSNGNKQLIGRCLYFPQVQERLAFSGFTIRGRCDPQVFDPQFASYLMRSALVTNQIFLGGRGTNISNLSQEILAEITVGIPALGEQRRIAQVLSTWDEAIESAERIAMNSVIAMSAMIEQSVLRNVRNGQWRMQHLSDIATRVQRREPRAVDVPVLMISSGSGFVRQDEKYSRFMAGKSVENYISLEEGEFAYNKGNSKRYEFGCVFPLKGLQKGLVPHVYVCFRLDEEHHPGFFEHLFAADFLHDQLGALVNTGVRNNGLLNIRPADFMACKVPVPPPDDQRRIAARLAVASEWVHHCEEYARQLKAEKAALMVDLLTGRRRFRLPSPKAV